VAGVADNEGRIDSVESRCYVVPTERPEADGTLAWSETTVVVVMARSGSETGMGWTYGAAAGHELVEEKLGATVGGMSALDVGAATEAMRRACRNLGRPGVASGAISAVDVALWDLKARLLGVSLRALLGRHRDGVPVYGSGGFTTYDEPTTEAQCRHWVEELGVRSVKIKVGEDWGRRAERDLARVALVRGVTGPETDVMVDANGAYSRKEAIRIGRRMLDEHGVVWFEEPVSSDDLDGLREVRDQVAIDVAAGEYGYDLTYFGRMVGAGAVDCLQADATRCCGYTGWLRAAAVAAAHSLEISAHCAPNLHAFVAGAVPNLRHIEYFHDHARLDPMLFDGLPEVRSGDLFTDDATAGHGVVLKEPDAESYRKG
jgi:L-alanine-DL-glutamate epimerase-like enolase superfamily enzyme